MKKYPFGGFLALLLLVSGLAASPLFSGCARVEKVVAVAGEESRPYESLGLLEVKIKADLVTPSNLLWSGVEAATLGFARTPTRGDLYKKKLDSLITAKARKYYKADRVIHVKYWPDLNSNAFPQGLIYARGEMIRYLPFPELPEKQG